MAQNKKLALALDFENAPQPLKDAAKAHQDAYLDLEVSTKQVDLWNHEKERNRKKFEQTLKQFNNQLDKWDPAGTKDMEPQVIEGGE